MAEDPKALALAERPLTVLEVVEHTKLVGEIMKQVMQKDQHYGLIPGCGDKPTLLKPGAEKLCLTFRLAPSYSAEVIREQNHLTIVSTCVLTHQGTSRVMGSGMGSCSTRESKYAYRDGRRKCPKCGKETIIKGKQEYGGGWLCFEKKGGCGAKFADNAGEILSQAVGRVANEDVADQYNTVLKMANKRSLIAAVLNVTAASDIFTQDIEDLQTVIDAEVVKRPDVAAPEEKKTETKAPPVSEPPPREPGDDQTDVSFDPPGGKALQAVKIIKINKKSGGSGEKAWTLFGLHVVDAAGGQPFWVNTFDKAWGAKAEAALPAKATCGVAYEHDGKGNKLTAFEVMA